MQTNKRSGFSLVELTIAMVMTLLILGGSSLMLTRGSEKFRSGTVEVSTAVGVARTLDEVVEALRMASTDSLNVEDTAPVGSTWIEFRRPAVDVQTGVVTPGELERIAMRPGPEEPRATEWDIVWTTNLGLADERTRVLCSKVRRALEGEVIGNGADDNRNGLVDERGLCFDLQDGRVDIHLTVETDNAVGGLARINLLRSISTRNR